MSAFRVRRSMMMTPGHRADRLAKAVALDVDAVVFDLEDGVGPAEKSRARATIGEALRALAFGRKERVVRVNAVGTPEIAADLEALPFDRIDALFVPKVESADQLRWLSRRLDRIETTREPGRRIDLIATVETPRGLLNALAIADASDRTSALFFGSGDYAAETGAALTASALQVPRSLIVAAAAAARRQAIDAAFFTAVKDAEATRQDALVARQLGFSGKLLFHPNQVAVVNEVFTPTPGEIARAERIVAAFHKATSSGEGTAYVDGEFVALDIALMAERTLAIARHAGVVSPRRS